MNNIIFGVLVAVVVIALIWVIWNDSRGGDN